MTRELRIKTVAVFLASLMTASAVLYGMGAGAVAASTSTSPGTGIDAGTSADSAGVRVQAAPVVGLEDATVEPGESGRVNLTLSEAPDGLSGYKVNVSLDDGTVAEVTGATYPSTFNLTETTITDGGTTITLKATDLNNRTVPGDTDILLATINVSGESAGRTNASVNVSLLDPDGAGPQISATTDPGLITVASEPDVSVAVSPPTYEQRLQDGVFAHVTVTNERATPIDDVPVRLEASGIYWTRDDQFNTTSWSLDLAANETRTLNVSLTEWAVDSIRPRFYSEGRVRLDAAVDIEDRIAEANEENNRAIDETVVTFSDLRTYTYTSYRGVVDRPQSLAVTVTNAGTAATEENHTVVVDLDNGTTRTFEVGPMSSRERIQRTYTLNYSATGTKQITSTVLGDRLDPYDDNNRSSDTVRIQEFQFDIDYVRAPFRVENQTQFQVWVSYDTNLATEVNLTLETPQDGVELAGDVPDNDATKTDQSSVWGGWTSWTLNATNASDGGRYRINVSGQALDESDTATDTVEVIVPKIRVTDQAVVRLDDETANGNDTLLVRNESTFDHQVELSVQAGAEGRTLQGLQYLFDYPYGCVEQTTSPLLAALSTDQYYRSPDRDPGPNYDRDETNKSIALGMERLSTGDNAQHDNGAWSMWGDDPAGDHFYTMYAYFGVTSVRNDPVQSENTATSGAQDVPTSVDAIDFNETIHWIRDQQQSDGAIDEGRGYFLENDEAMTGFALISVDQAEESGLNSSTANATEDLRADAARYLVDQEEDGGSWGDGHTKTTALAVWGLQTVRESGDIQDSNLSDRINASIENGTAWLLDDQKGDGGFSFDRNPYWSSNQRRSSATAWSLLALNATGIPADNSSLVLGSTFLINVYDQDGSWGGTESTGLAIRALNELGTGLGTVERTVTVTIDDDDGAITKQAEVNATTDIVTLSLDEDERAMLQDGSIAKRVDVTSTGSGPVIVALENDQVVSRTEYEATERRLGTLSTTATMDGGLSALAATAESGNEQFDVSVSVPDDFSTGENQTLSVTVTNKNDTADLLNPIVEIPLTSSFDASDPLAATTTVNGSTETRDVEVMNSTLTDSRAIFVFGNEVPAGESRTYDVNITVPSPGDVTIATDTRPLYNESFNVNATGTFTAAGVGTLNVEVVDGAGSPVGDANITVAGSRTTADSVSRQLSQGTYEVTASAGSTTFSSVNVSLSAFETENVTFVVPPASVADPAVTVRTADGVAVRPGSVGRTTVREADASTAEVSRLTFNVTGPGAGNATAVVAVNESVERAFRSGQSRTVALESAGTAVTIADRVGRDGTPTALKLGLDSETAVNITYTGYKLGDVTGDDAVTAADAEAAARDVANDTTANEYGDASNDGQVTAVDAMFIAQHAGGNRYANYSASATTAAPTSSTITVGVSDPVRRTDSFTSTVRAEGVAESDDIGAYRIDVTYDPTDVDAGNVSVDASGAGDFAAVTAHPEAGVVTVVGYTDQLDTSNGTVALASLTIDGTATVGSANLSVEVETLTDTGGNSLAATSDTFDFTACAAEIVGGGDGQISLTEIQTAINWWAEDTQVPDTGGETLSLTEIQTLINAWAEDTPVTCD